MKKYPFIMLFIIGAFISVLVFSSCVTTGGGNDNTMLVGTWLSNDLNERWTFNSDGTFVNEIFTTVWEEFISGTYSFSSSSTELTANTAAGTFVFTLLLDDSGNLFAYGTDACIGGITSTLLGNWVGTAVWPTLTHTNTWIFTGSSVTYHVIITGLTDYSNTGDVVIDTVGKTFTVSNSTNPIQLSNGTFDYMIIGSGISIADNPGDDPDYFNKM